MNSLFLKALRCEPIHRPPVWLMRQAGRYMPEYRKIRENHALWEMFHNPNLIEKITRLPLDLLGVDAAILFSDILVIAESLGLQLEFPEGLGPRVYPPIHTKKQVEHLPLLDVKTTLSYVFEGICRLKMDLQVPLIGFCGGPFTVASYLIDSTSRTAFERTKQWMQLDPASFHLLLEKITLLSIAYLQEQIASGVDVVQIFDSWGSILDDDQFEQFCLPYLQKMINAIQTVPVIIFCRSSSLRYVQLSRLKPTCISFDWHFSMQELRDKVPKDIAIQGNFDPAFLKNSPEAIAEEVRKCLASLEGRQGVIINLGHGVTPDIPMEHVRTFVETVKSSPFCNRGH